MGRFTGLSSFFPGAIREPPKPCGGCVRYLGPNSTSCPGCDAKIVERKRQNPKPPPGFYGNNIPFGQAGWRVGRGRRINVVYPIQLRNYSCYMQQGIRQGKTFLKRKEILPSRIWNTLLDRKPKTAIIRGDGTGTHLLSGTWERPHQKDTRAMIKNKRSKFVNRTYMFPQTKCLGFYLGDDLEEG